MTQAGDVLTRPRLSGAILKYFLTALLSFVTLPPSFPING